MDRTQAHRLLAVNSPLGEDVLLLRRFTGYEELARPFEYDLDLLSEQDDLDTDTLLGAPICVRASDGNGHDRFFNGIVSEIQQEPSEEISDTRLAVYRATVVPWFWLLTRTQDCRIYQRKSVLNIIKDVFKQFGFSDFKLKLTESYRQRDYCVQYRESYFDFLSRLMEQEGIYYYFEHAADRHTMVLCDSINAHNPLERNEKIPFKPQQDADQRMERIDRWTLRREVRSGIYSHGDFDFKKPATPLRHTRADPRKHSRANYEVFDYPGNFVEHDHGDRAARVRSEEINARHETVKARSDVQAMTVGATFELIDHPRADQNRDYLVTSVKYVLTSDEFDSKLGQGTSAGNGLVAPTRAGEVVPFSCELTAIPSSVPFRPERLTPPARVDGPQTAIVTGPAKDTSEEIYTDESGHGRVKVRFHWDRYWEGEANAKEDSSCWVRVSQAWAGKGWGGLQVPRVGQEVIVDFVEGDPDRPIITGKVYNGNVRPPQSLPASKAVNSMRSNSYPGGGGSNEISMDDTKGKENFLVHAQFDMNETVEHDQNVKVGNNQIEAVGVNRTETVGTDETLTVGNNKTESVGANRTRNVGSNESVSVGSNQTVSIGADKSETVALLSTESVGAAKMLNVGAGYSITVGAAMNTAVGLASFEEVGLIKTLIVGVRFEVICGSGKLTIDSGGKVTIEGTEFEFKSSGPVKINGSVIDLNL